MLLCVAVAKADSQFADEEKNMIYEYCHEMRIKSVIPNYSYSTKQLLAALSKTTSEMEKKLLH